MPSFFSFSSSVLTRECWQWVRADEAYQVHNPSLPPLSLLPLLFTEASNSQSPLSPSPFLRQSFTSLHSLIFTSTISPPFSITSITFTLIFWLLIIHRIYKGRQSSSEHSRIRFAVQRNSDGPRTKSGIWRTCPTYQWQRNSTSSYRR